MIFFFRRGAQSKADIFFKYFKITDFFRIWLHGRFPIQQNIRKSNTGNFRNIVSLIFCETGKSLLGGM